MASAGDSVAGKYRLECPLGEGGMGSVWRALHVELGAQVAVKFPHAHRAASSAAVARFRREARAAAKLKNPHVVRILDFGLAEETPYLVMELLEGESLKARLSRRQTWSLAEAVELAQQTANALQSVHAAGIVHRDLKPSNLFLVTEGERELVKLLDFGVAKWFDGVESGPEGNTESGLVVGSVQYMSPEQARGEPVDQRSDVWALGVVLYQVLTGMTPFQGANAPDTIRRVCAGNFDAVSLHLGPTRRPLDAVFQRAFELDRERRIQTASEFSRLLSEAAREAEPALRISSRAPNQVPHTFGRDDSTLSAFAPPPTKAASPRGKVLATAVAVLISVAGFAAFRGLYDRAALPESIVEPRSSSSVPPSRPSPRAATSPHDVGNAAPVRELPSATPPTPNALPAPLPELAERTLPRPNRRAVQPKPPPAVASTPVSQIDPVFGLEVPR